MNAPIHATVAPIVLCIATAACAQFALDNATQDAGGGRAAGATYDVNGTVAQAEAGPTLAGSTYALRGGFWPGASATASSGCVADFDNDGDVDLGDFGVFGGAFGSVLGEPGFDDVADFDDDGDVDLGDFGVFGGQFGRADCFD